MQNLSKISIISGRSGFSLVELAISVIIIGLLTAMVVKGGQMIDGAKVRSTILQLQTFESAVGNFQTTFQALPGDFDGVSYLQGCSSSVGCDGGDGDGKVFTGDDTPPFNADLTDSGESYYVGSNPEPQYFWRQLFFSGLMRGLPDGDVYDYGSILPTANVEGGFEFFHDTNLHLGGDQRDEGHFFRLAGAVDMSMGLDGSLAFMIDQKIDDGKPYSGEVFGEGCIASSAYDRGGVDCIMFFKYNRN